VTPYFPDGRANEYISPYIATGFGRLRYLGVEVDVSPALKAFAALDAVMQERYEEILKFGNAKAFQPRSTGQHARPVHERQRHVNRRRRLLRRRRTHPVFRLLEGPYRSRFDPRPAGAEHSPLSARHAGDDRRRNARSQEVPYGHGSQSPRETPNAAIP